MKNLIVVVDKKTEKYGNYLRGLVSSSDDKEGEIVGTKDGEVKILIYDEKKYIANKQNIASEQYVLFIGNSELAKKERLGINYIYNEYGMVFGKLGKSGFLYVDKVVQYKDYENFIKMAQNIQADVKKVSMEGKDVAQVVGGAAAGVAIEAGTAVLGAATIIATGALLPVVALGGAAVLAGGGIGAVKYKAKQNEVINQQYMCLVLKCYLEYLNGFLNL